MDGFNLRCNTLQCREYLESRAVVTTCSHIFCHACANNLQLINPPQGSPRQCPACEVPLSNPDDVVVTRLNPTEDYKTSCLSGLPPSTIMDICSRGMAFWNYQVTQEIAYQDTIMNSMKERLEGLTISLEQVYSEANSEISRLQGKVAALSTSEDDLKRKNHELKEGWREKSRKLAQTQELYDKLKCRSLISQVSQGAAENFEREFAYSSQHHQTVNDLVGPSVPMVQRNHSSMRQNLSSTQQNIPLMRQNQPMPHISQHKVRRSKNMADPDFITGARVGTATGGQLEVDESSVGRRSPEPGYNQGIYRGGVPNGIYGQQMQQTQVIQEHRQRLPPTPMNIRRTVFGQSNTGVGMGTPGNRNHLGATSSISIGRANPGGGGGGGYFYTVR